MTVAMDADADGIADDRDAVYARLNASFALLLRHLSADTAVLVFTLRAAFRFVCAYHVVVL
jgi:hypothetical protein